jgi:hypothetical protein
MTKVQAVFSTPLILPRQFLDSTELPSDEFITKVSCALSAIEHHFIKHHRCQATTTKTFGRSGWPVHQCFCLARRTVPALQPLYDNPYNCLAVLRQSLHHFTLQMGDKTDKMSTLQLKAYSDPTAAPRGRPPIICFWDFPSPGDTVALKVHFAPQHTKETFSPGQPLGGFARLALFPLHQQPACYHRAQID